MGNMGSVTDHGCDIAIDAEEAKCDGRGRCTKRLRISHANDAPITEDVCKSFWKEACVEEGKKCNVDAVASVEFEHKYRANTAKTTQYVKECKTRVWKTATHLEQTMQKILQDISKESENTDRVQILVKNVIILWEYADTVLTMQNQKGTTGDSQLKHLMGQYYAIMNNKELWICLTQNGIECNGKLKTNIQEIHKNIMTEMKPNINNIAANRFTTAQETEIQTRNKMRNPTSMAK